MKLKIIFLLLLINIITLKAQISFSQEDIDVFISYLDSTNIGDISGVVSNLIEANVSQALPKIEQNFWDHNCHTQQWLLKAMYNFNSQFTQEYCYALLDSLNKPQKEKYDPNEKYNGYDCIDILSAKVSCIEILYKLGDFSRVDEVFEMVDRDKLNGTSFSNAVILLPYIFKNRPDIKEQAKQEMLDAIADTEDDFAVFAYSLTLTQAFGEEEIPEMVQLFKTTTNPQAKRGLLEFYFSKYEDKFDLDGLVKETLLTEQNQELRLYLSKVLILGFATPSDYVFLTNYIQSEPSDTIKSLIQLEIDAFRPPLPDSMNSTNDLLNNLYNYADSVSNYTWLGDQQFKDELHSIIQSAKSNLQAGDSIACAVQVKAFQDLVDNVYKDSLNTDPRFVTIESWKFLYWNAQYILDRLPESDAIKEE